MKTEDFEQLATDAGMDIRRGLGGYGVAFGVVLRTPTQFGVRIQVDWLAYEPAEFAMMTQEQAQRQIAMCKKRLERAAQTQQGVVK